MDYLEQDFGIKRGQIYKIIYVTSINTFVEIIGNVLYFDKSQMAVKSNKGFYIVRLSKIEEMYPIGDI